MAQYVPTPSWTVDGTDVTEYVANYTGRRGWNVISSSDGRNLIDTSGDLLLKNQTGFWTDSRLGALDRIVFRLDGVVRGQFGVLSFKANAPNRTVLLSLGSINNPDTPIAWSVAVNTPIADLLTGIGVTVTPDAPWENYRVGAGEEYADTFITFQRDLSIFSDSYVYEDENGDLRAMTPSTENRSASITVAPDQFSILRRYTNSQTRRGFSSPRASC